MKSEDTTIINRLGLHARAAAQLVKLANQFKSEVTLTKFHQKANAKTIMEVLMLAATKGSPLTISASGPDEEDAVKALIELIENKFNEVD